MEKKLYKYSDEILFRTCDLFSCDKSHFGDCSNNKYVGKNGFDMYTCLQSGVHYHCAIHPEIELEVDNDKISDSLYCPKCKKSIDVKDYNKLRNKCLSIKNREIFKDATLIRLDDWYVPEVKIKDKPTSDYDVITNVKTDKDGDTVVVIYVTHKGTDGKAQLFIKPEKLQLTHDFKDLDPAKVLSKIELTLKDRTITQEYKE